jgi:hypothetical protein
MKMKAKVLAFVALILGLLTMGHPLFAHHGDAAYDTSKVVELKGAVVTAYDWMNPHSLIKVDYKNDKGVLQHWVVEIGSVPSMTLLGWNRTTLKPGDVVTLDIWATRNGTTVGRINKLVLADGTVLKDRDTSAPSRYGTEQK